jgi:large subunit ribosomal protein L5
MAAATETAPPARLKQRYLEEIRPALIERFGYSSMMQAPRLEKITLNMGVGLARQDNKMLRAATEQLATIAGQQPSVRRARKSIAAFKLREGMPVGVAVTLRGERGYEFLDRLISIAIPRIRDFRGLNPRSFDGRGNYSLGVREQIIVPEIDYDAIDQVRGLDITITTSAQSDAEAFALLAALGLPFSAERRPRAFEALDGEGSAEPETPERPNGAAASQGADADTQEGAQPAAAAPELEQAAAPDAPELEAQAEPAVAEASAEAEPADRGEPEAPEPTASEPDVDASGSAEAQQPEAGQAAQEEAASEPAGAQVDEPQADDSDTSEQEDSD